jgi:hypothetical protein
MCFVYWIYDDSCIDEKLHGYVGVSYNPEKRYKIHIRRNRVPNQSSMKILFEGTRNECFEFERSMRPAKSIGWNNAIGGSHGWRIGFNHNEVTKEKMRQAWSNERREKASIFRKQINLKLKGQIRPKQSEAMKGENNPIFGTKRPQHVRDAISKAHAGKPAFNRQELYCISCHKRASFSILVKYHAKCYKRICESIKG